mmetsp:Transcript_4931/g.17633  ORF Transcript_4931/g.17633 Transcript_4931/m.17633 type:complete len:201 (-) Transcript_4931:434-1036(-)
MRVVIPPRALEEVPGDVTPVLGRFRRVRERFRVQDVEVPLHGVDGDFVFPRIVLQRPGEKRLREEKTADPVHRRRAFVDPVVDELNALEQVEDPRRQRLQRRVRFRRPGFRDLVVEDRIRHRLQLGRHHDETFERFQAFLQRPPHDDQQRVVSNALLGQHRVHGLVVIRRVLVRDLVDVERLGAPREDIRRARLDDVLSR